MKNSATFVLLISIALFSGCMHKTEETKTPASIDKPSMIWFDAEANFQRFSYPDSIDYYLEKIKNIGFTDAIIDIRPITGEVLYKSDYAPQMTEWKGFERTDFDYLGHFIKKAHELGLRVHASMNTFVGGHNYFDRGQVYANHPEWATMVYTPTEGIVSIMSQKKKYSAMINPINTDFQKHILNVFREVVSKYPDLDGIILDRVRYDGIMADFSDFTRHKFEEYLGEKIQNFPEDIYEWKTDENGKSNYVPGKYFKKWIEWRAMNIYNFMSLAAKTVKEVNPEISFGTYTGAWYPSYFEVGVNWASNQYDVSKDFDWATPEYKNYGYAEVLDLFTVGNYYTDITMDEYLQNNNLVKNETDSKAARGTWYCVEGSCEKIKEILNGHPFYGGILVDQFYDNPQQLSRSIAMNFQASDGLMMFDIVHVIQKNLWKEVEDGFKMAADPDFFKTEANKK
ncbi:Glycosyl hydrolase-like 10 [Mariniphaga anaerophila]|uniref:Glycosyl hydrolase-like 10 n=1 Tax=Mariniphaga anaerophila TaxID=1484053 RepID=A0A1M5G451_9BACT|nr:alpha amylase family protein [Mariniphaga anaerophila]SHF98580.1 Glycosyl hydrolase-like 10 [Mariniphaga anaerophila]